MNIQYALSEACHNKGYKSHIWLTLKQAQTKKLAIKKGETPTTVYKQSAALRGFRPVVFHLYNVEQTEKIITNPKQLSFIDKLI